jgi:hypothetical protein
VLDESEQHWPIRIEDRTGFKRIANLSEFISHRDHGHTRSCAYPEGTDALRGREGDVTRIKALTRLEKNLMRLNVLTRVTDIVAGPDRAAQDDDIAVALDLLLHDDRIRSIRKRGAGEEPSGLPRRNPTAGTAGRDPADDIEAVAGDKSATGRQGVAIHRGLGERWRRNPRNDWVRKCTPCCLYHWDYLGPGQRRGIG